MKFLISTQMSNILRFQVYANNLLYISKFGIYLNDKILEQPNEFNVAYFWNKYAVFGNLEKMAMVSLSNEEIRILNPQYSYYWKYYKQEGNQVLISQNRRKNQSGIRIADYHLLNLNNETLGERIFIEKPQIFIFHHKGLFIEQTTLKSLSLLTGEYEWEVDLGGRIYLDDSKEEKIAAIMQILGVWENQLLVVMDNCELISIDIHTGQLLWNKADIYTHTLSSFPNRSMFWGSYWHLENGYLYQLDGNVYYRVSLKTQALDILWQDLAKENYLTCTHKTYTEDYIYFTGSYNRDLSPYLLGVFNRKTLQIEWLYDFGDQLANPGDYAHSLNQPPQVAENKLYVLDSGGTLHIFEREA